MVERGVESLFGGSKRAGWDCSPVTETIGEPSRGYVLGRLRGAEKPHARIERGMRKRTRQERAPRL
jgi:hypothetical protein